MARKGPAVILLHGSGVHPQEAFGWTSDQSYRPRERATNSTFIGIAGVFAEAGYTVYVPWLADNAASEFWPQFQWAALERNGAALRARVPTLGPLHFLVNEVRAGADYLSALPEVESAQLAIVGWGEGAQLAAISAAIDTRFAAVVRLSAPLDRAALRGTVGGVLEEPQFMHIDCALGDAELAVLIAPRPLLYAYSTKDESVARHSRFISWRIANAIREPYIVEGQGSRIGVVADTSWSATSSRRVRNWVDAALHFSPRDVPGSISIRQPASQGENKSAWIDSTRAYREEYVAGLGTCVAAAPRADFSSVAAFERSVQPFRESVARRLGLTINARQERVSVLERSTLTKRPAYSLQFIRFRSARTAMVISGLLAIPDSNSATPFPAVVSADGDAGLGAPFGLEGREPRPFLNEYADRLASAGTLVFVPYYPFQFPEIAAAEAASRNPGESSSLSFLLPVFSAGADLLLSMRGVDSTRLGIWGISFGGVAALYTGAIDTRFSSVVYSNPVVTAEVLYMDKTSAALAAWWPEICSTVDGVQAYLIAPRRLVRENGLLDNNGSERTFLETVKRVRDVYRSIGLESQFEFVRHGGGHETRPREVRVFPP